MYVPGKINRFLGYPKYQIRTIYNKDGSVNHYEIRTKFGFGDTFWWYENGACSEDQAEKIVLHLQQRYQKLLENKGIDGPKPKTREVPPFKFIDPDKKSS